MRRGQVGPTGRAVGGLRCVIARVIVRGAVSDAAAAEYVSGALEVGDDGGVDGHNSKLALVSTVTNEATRLDALLELVEAALREGYTNCGEDPDCLWAEPLAQVRRYRGEMAAPAAAAVARIFSSLLRQELGEEKMAEVVRLNAKESDPNVCHSHDFIDSNDVMAEAFRQVVGRLPRPSSDADSRLWGAAWDLAAKGGFAV